jgi:parvulin-like peptidyl-prolyl isomerase
MYLVFAVGAGCTAMAAELDPQTVVATVGDDAIRAGEVARLVALATRGQEVHPSARPILQAQSLAELVERRLVLAYAVRTKTAASRAQIEALLTELKQKLTTQGRRWEDYLQKESLSETDLRRQIAWNLAWSKYVARYVTEPRLQAYFAAHQAEFDGRELSLSQILLRPARGDGPDKWPELVARAENIRRAITAGEISFAEAAAKYSAGPSARQGGRLGFVPRHGVMDESFSRAAFALAEGQISPPVQTPFGVHLIRCDAIRPGTRKWSDVRKPLEEALGRELLEKLAQSEQAFTRVEFTGKAPYFPLGTRKLVLP